MELRLNDVHVPKLFERLPQSTLPRGNLSIIFTDTCVVTAQQLQPSTPLSSLQPPNKPRQISDQYILHSGSACEAFCGSSQKVLMVLKVQSSRTNEHILQHNL